MALKHVFNPFCYQRTVPPGTAGAAIDCLPLFTIKNGLIWVFKKGMITRRS